MPAAHADPSPSAADIAAGANWGELQNRIQGQVVLPTDGGYGAAKQIFNTRFDDLLPAAVVQVSSAEDVAAAVSFAGENGLRFAARSGGHSYAGVSSATGVMIIDLRGLTGVDYDNGSAVIGPGNALSDVYQALDGYGQTLPTGMCPSVGIAGLTLGGGLGFESREYGVTCDRLTGATLVLPDGTITQVSDTSRPDLLWALRGGGQFAGVATSFTYNTCPATSKDVVAVTFPGDHAAQAITGWQQWLQTADHSQWADVSIDADGHGGLRCWMQIVCPADSGDSVVDALSDAIGMRPLTVESRTLSHMDSIVYLAGGSLTEPRASFTNGSDIVAKLDQNVIGVIIEAITAFSQAGNTGWVQINTLDGAVRDTPLAEAAYPWRNHAAMVEWGAYQPIPSEIAMAWVFAAHQLIRSASSGGYVNYLEPGDRIERYFGDNWSRLNAVRNTVDPDNRIYTVLVN
ncbi:FAD-binding protein [Nocardia sp. NPDC088792]|uniref:FAD-dependent oxidoreductase n=1 Tax=Nocardia sp. NPDC088792 TaxID=3364332 RepID=UPI003812A8CC